MELLRYQFAPPQLWRPAGDQCDDLDNTPQYGGGRDNEVHNMENITQTEDNDGLPANGDNCSLDSERSLGTAWERLGKHTYTHPHIHHNDDDDDIDVYDNSDGDD